MMPADVFGVVVRSVGLVMLMPAGYGVLGGLVNLLLGGPGNSFGMFVGSIPVALVGIWMLRGAPAIVNFAYPGTAPRSATHPLPVRAGEAEFGR